MPMISLESVPCLTLSPCCQPTHVLAVIPMRHGEAPGRLSYTEPWALPELAWWIWECYRDYLWVCGFFFSRSAGLWWFPL